MVIRSSVIAVLSALGLGLTTYAQGVPGKIGVINIQGAIVGTKDGQKASQELTTKFDPKQKDIQNRQNELSQLKDQYQKSGNLMSEDKRSQMAREIDEKQKRLERDVQDAQEELNAEQQRVLQNLGQRMMAVITKYAKDNGYAMILDDSNPNTPLLYAASGIDITQDIISLYDKTTTNGGPVSTPGASTTPPAGGGAGTPASPPGQAAAVKPPAPGTR